MPEKSVHFNNFCCTLVLPGKSEACLRECCGHRWKLLLLMVDALELVGGEIAEGLHESLAIVPGDPGEGLELELGAAAPGSEEVNDLGLVEADEGLGEGVVVGVAHAAYGLGDAGLGKSVIRFKTDGSNDVLVVIDGGNNGRGVTFANFETVGSTLNGFTITNGHEINGGGILCLESSPSLLNLIVEENQANYGGGMELFNSDARIENVVVRDNVALVNGGGIRTVTTLSL